MQKVYAAKEKDIAVKYDANGFYMEELLPGTYRGGVCNYKCYLRAGSEISPRIYGEDMVVLMFGKGRGYIKTKDCLDKITEIAFYVPDFQRQPYVIHAFEDMEFVYSVIKMNQWDKELYAECHTRLPFFTLISDVVIYDQDCKGPDTTSWWILSAGQLGRIMLGVVRGVGGGTVEKGHPRVAQWNYCVGNSDFLLTVEDAPAIEHKSGDWSYIPAGFDHSLVAEPGKEVFYIWFEHHKKEKDFCFTPDPEQDSVQVQ